ncbi:MAG TPA: LysR family transcriptional regulator [Acetobacteraceae bacterium]|nr:LysR family transcriptional regulator [Acetobacteraceae bacterium]
MSTIDHSNITRFDLNLLVAFDALMSERSVTRAAQRLGITQSAMSHNLGRLRAVFDDELFARSPKGVEPTPRAQALAGIVGSVLCTVQGRLLATEDFDPAVASRRFTIGMSDYLEGALLPYLVPTLRAEAPGVSLEVRSVDQVYATELLDEGKIDLGLGRIETGGVLHKRRKLWSDRYVVLCPPDAVQASGALDLETFLASPHAVLSARDGNCRLVDDALAELGLQRFAVVTTPHVYALPELVRMTGVLATLPATIAGCWASLFGLAVSELPFAVPSFDISMTWHASFDRDPAHLWLRARILSALDTAHERLSAHKKAPPAEADISIAAA